MKTITKNIKGKIYAAVFCLATALGTLFCTLLYLLNSDVTDITQSGEIVHRSLLFRNNGYSTAFIVFALLCVLFFASAAVTFQKKSSLTAGKSEEIFLIFDRSITGIALLSTVILQFRLESAYTPYEISRLQYVSLALALLASLYFLVPLFVKSSPQTVRIVLGMCVVGWLCCQALSLHFYMLDYLNAPTRTFALLGNCALIFFFLSELHFNFDQRPGKKAAGAPGGILAVGMIAAFLCITDGLSELILSVSSKAGFSVELNTFYVLCRLCMGVYALLFVLSLLLRKEESFSTLPSEDKETRGKENEKAEGEEGQQSKNAKNEENIQENQVQESLVLPENPEEPPQSTDTDANIFPTVGISAAKESLEKGNAPDAKAQDTASSFVEESADPTQKHRENDCTDISTQKTDTK